MPPKLSAGAMFWLGAAMLAVGVVGNWITGQALIRSDMLASLLLTWAPVFSAALNLAYYIGAAFVAVSFAVRALAVDRDLGRGPTTAASLVQCRIHGRPITEAARRGH